MSKLFSLRAETKANNFQTGFPINSRTYLAGLIILPWHHERSYVVARRLEGGGSRESIDILRQHFLIKFEAINKYLLFFEEVFEATIKHFNEVDEEFN